MKNKTANMFSLDFFRSILSSKETTRIILRLIGLVMLFHAGTSFAANGTDTTGAPEKATNVNSSSSQDDWDVQLTKLLTMFVGLLYVILSPAALLAGWFLTPDWTFGEIFGLREPLHNLWILVSNVVYIIFALVLIVIAFLHIFGEGEKDYAIKSALPKLAVGLLIVPFTWFFVSATTSVANYLTASVMQLPREILTQEQLTNVTFKVPKKCTINFNQKIQTADGSGGNLLDCGKDEDKTDMTLQDFLSMKQGSYNLLTMYAYSVFHFDQIQSITSCGLDSIKKLTDISLQTLISLVFFVMYGLLLLALVSALAARAVQLWFFAVISPLFGLFYFFKKGWLKSIEDKYGISQLIALAMVPVYVAAALVFGLVFLQVAQSSKPNPDAAVTASYFVKQKKCESGDANCQSLTFGEPNANGGGAFTLETKGQPFAMNNKCGGGDGDAPTTATDILNLASGAIGKVIINILGLIVMWTAVFAALNTSKITKEAVKPIADFGNSIGETMSNLPKNMPMTIPGTNGKQISMAGLSQTGRDISSAVSAKGSQYKGGFDQGSFAKILGKEMGGEKLLAELQDLNRKSSVSMNVPSQVGEYLRNAFKIAGQNGYNMDDIAANKNGSKKNLEKILIEKWVDKQIVEKILSGRTGMELAGNVAQVSNKNFAGGMFNGKVVTNEEAYTTLNADVVAKKADSTSTENKNTTTPTTPTGGTNTTGGNSVNPQQTIIPSNILEDYNKAKAASKTANTPFNLEEFLKNRTDITPIIKTAIENLHKIT